MRLSVIITTRNRKEDLLNCVKSIENSRNLPRKFELIIVDDCSTDGTEKLNDYDFQLEEVKVIHNATQEMMVKARNVGAINAKGAFLLFIDDDNVIDKWMIHCLLRFAEKNTKYGIIGPSMYYANKEKYMDFQKINFFTGKTKGCLAKAKQERYESHGIPNVFMIRKVVFEECGYFDESLLQTFTEPDFGFAAKRKGYLCAIVPKAKAYHNISRQGTFGPRSLGGEHIQKAYCLMRNRSLIIARYGRWFHKITYFLVFSWVWPLVYSLIIIRFKRFDLIRLYWSGWKDGQIYFLTGKLRNSIGQNDS